LQRFAIIGVHGDPHSRPDRDKLHNAQINSIKTLDEVGSFIWDDVTLQRRKSMGTSSGRLDCVRTCTARLLTS